MNDLLNIYLLGGLRLERGGSPVTGIELRKAAALVAYVACVRRPVPRETLADLFWSDRSQASALGNLRVVLTNLRQTLGEHLTITRQTVELIPAAYWLDVRDLETGIDAVRPTLAASQPLSRTEATNLAASLDLYRGDFLQGVYLREADGVEEWAVVERERLRGVVENAHHDLVDFYLNIGDYRSGLEWAGRLLKLDPLRESAHRQMMLLLARNGQTAEALAQYEACRCILAAELGAQPEPETESLYARLKDSGAAYRHNLPPQTTPFIGRQAELHRLSVLLSDPTVRLITLTGPGGMGKTRLALQAAAHRIGDQLHGVWFVPLAGISTGEAGILAAIAEALGFVPSGQADLKYQLLAYLHQKEALLVIDNFEHLVESANLVGQLAQACPHLKLLVTSRERLNLSGETLLEVAGLGLPSDSANAAEASSAIQLFLQSARRLSSHLAASPAINQICQLTAGMPLAIELAAAWVRVMPPEAIAREIEQDIDFLVAPLRDVPERHRSIRAVFEHSWRLLSLPEQSVFASLSVFRGGFTLEAAREVAGASSTVLLALTDQSLVARDALDRYYLHPLLRQYAANKLAPESIAPARHAAHYTRLLGDQQTAMTGPGQAAALHRVAGEMENIRAAWDWLLSSLNQPDQVETALTMLSSSLDSLHLFYSIRCRFNEADVIFTLTAQTLESIAPTTMSDCLLARVLAHHGDSLRYSESAQRARDLSVRSEALLAHLGLKAERAEPLLSLGYLAMRQGDYDQARRCLEESLLLAREAGNLRRTAATLNLLAEVHDHQGDFVRAKECDEAHLTLQRQLGDPRGIAKALNGLAVSWLREDAFERAEAAMAEALDLFQQVGDLNGVATSYGTRGNAAQYLGWYEAAEGYYTESYKLCRDLADFWGEALALHNLGELAALRGNRAEAQRLYRECIALYRQHDIRSGLMNALADLAHCQIESGDYDSARACLRDSMTLAREAGEAPMLLKALAVWAGLLVCTDQPEQAAAVLGLVSSHPSTEETARKWLGPLRLQLEQVLTAEVLASQIIQGRDWSLDEAARL